MKTWKEVATGSDCIQAYNNSELRWCNLCQADHGPDLLCFHEQHMSPEQQDIFRDLLNQSLHFTWDTEGSHQEVFRICTSCSAKIISYSCL